MRLRGMLGADMLQMTAKVKRGESRLPPPPTGEAGRVGRVGVEVYPPEPSAAAIVRSTNRHATTSALENRTTPTPTRPPPYRLRRGGGGGRAVLSPESPAFGALHLAAQSSSDAGTLPPLAASAFITALYSQMFISALPSVAPV